MTWHARVPAWVLRHYTDPIVRAAVLELYLHADRDGLVRMSRRQWEARLHTGSRQAVQIRRKILAGPIKLEREGAGRMGATYRVPLVVHSPKRPRSGVAATPLTGRSGVAATPVTEKTAGRLTSAPQQASSVHSPADDGTGVCTVCELPVNNQRHRRSRTA